MIWPDPTTLPGISPHQQGALAQVFSGPVGILTGGPGTGKTRTAAAALRALIDSLGASSVAVCAPTGKAAVRIMAELSKCGLSHPATTIHRLLGVQRNGHDGKGWGFRHDAGNPLPYRVVAIEEASMADTDLSANLLSACAPGTHLLVIGDTGQLPPVGHGAPLRDWIAAGLPHGELTETWRNGGDIVRACAAIRAGKPFRPSEYIDIEAGKNWLHVEARPAAVAGVVERIVSTLPAGIDPLWDVQVSCAVNEKGDCSRLALNKLLQGVLNPAGEKIQGTDFRLRDKVICTSNCMLPVSESGTFEPVSECASDFVANGEIGQVIAADKGVLLVQFTSPARVVQAVGEFREAFELAYAVTTHKSQGSQWPVVIAVIDHSRSADGVCSNEWWFTALSRMERLCVTIGPLETLRGHCLRRVLPKRKTFLREKLMGLEWPKEGM